MKGLILVNAYTQSEHELNQPRRIQAELAARGTQCDLVRNDFVPAYLSGGVRSDAASAYDFCVYLDKDSYASHLLERAGMRLFNRADAVEDCDDKMRTHIALAGIVPMPTTVAAPLCYTPGAPLSAQFLARTEAILGYPVVIKECYGSLGKGVYLAHDRRELEAIAEKLQRVPHLYQRFIAESAGQDLRVIVIGGKAIAAMRRVSQNDFRSNAELGGRGEKAVLDRAAADIAERAAQTLGLDYCGVDLLLSGDGPLVCEVNSNAFFGTFERVTGVNVAGLYADHILRTLEQTPPTEKNGKAEFSET